MTDYIQDFRERLRVIIESPYARNGVHTITDHMRYFDRCVDDSLARGEAPFGSHGFYTIHLDDDDPAHRKLGIQCGYTWMLGADFVAVYTDYGISKGMQSAIDFAFKKGIPIETREIGKWL